MQSHHPLAHKLAVPRTLAVGVSEENNNMDRIPNNTSLYKYKEI